MYRVYNNRPDANHGYTTSLQTRNDMVALGWIVEGFGLPGLSRGPRDVRASMTRSDNLAGT